MSIQNIKINFEIIFDINHNMIFKIDCWYLDKHIPLVLSSFLQFLYEHETKLSPSESEFCYGLAKFIKKIKYGEELIYGIPSDYDIASFFERAVEYNIELNWIRNGKSKVLEIGSKLPISILVTQKGPSLKCTLLDKEEWLENPLAWLTYEKDNSRFYFSDGILLIDPPQSLERFLLRFLDHDFVVYSNTDALTFVNNIYKPSKYLLDWQIKADFLSLVPKEVVPIPLLNLTYKEPLLTPTLAYQYADVVVESDNLAKSVNRKSDGALIKRIPKMEAVYQEDVMELFQEYELPFMLQSPGDIAKFMGELVPKLISRGWVVNSDVPEFNVDTKPYDLSFQVQSSGKDWFHFDPNCEVNGQKMSLQEIARLMIDNQGYVKTTKGFVKISKKSQNELKILAEFGAFSVSKKFDKREILPLISISKIEGKDSASQILIDRVQHVHKNPCTLSSDFKATLRDYQQYGVNWIHFLQQTGFGGVLADDMGLGKTVQTLGFCSQLQGNAPVLILGPTNVVYNWISEIKTFLPGKTSLAYTGGDRHKQIEKLIDVDFVITSFGVMKNDIDWFKSIDFKAIIVDEAQFLKNSKTQISKAAKLLKSDFKLALTGTPIENYLSDLWNIFDFVMPNYLGTQRSFESDVKDGRLERVRAKVKPFILRREKREVLDSLPEKTEVILKCPLSKEQERVYQTILAAVKSGITDSVGKRNRLHVLTSLLKLRQVCTHPGLLKELGNKDIPSAKYDIIRDKIETLVEEDHKITIFSQFTGMLDILQEWIEEKKYYFERIDGSVTGKNRMDAVDRFQKSEKPGVFLISLKAGGVGINLTSADYVFHMDPWWNPAAEAQATDRVHRMGQKNKVMVYKLITEGTIEEKIQELQEEKKKLVAEIIDIDSVGEKSIDLETIKSLL